MLSSYSLQHGTSLNLMSFGRILDFLSSGDPSAESCPKLEYLISVLGKDTRRILAAVAATAI